MEPEGVIKEVDISRSFVFEKGKEAKTVVALVALK
jgi:hypothetical protein